MILYIILCISFNAESGNNPDLLQSTILVELYTRFIEVNDNTFVKTACESIAEVIQKHLVQRLSKLRFLAFYYNISQ